MVILKLRSTGCARKAQKVAALRGDREAKEGVVLARTTADHKTGIAFCVSCETDFVSKNADFVAFAQSIGDAAISNNVKSLDELNNVTINGSKVSELVNDKLAIDRRKDWRYKIRTYRRGLCCILYPWCEQDRCTGWDEQSRRLRQGKMLRCRSLQ